MVATRALSRSQFFSDPWPGWSLKVLPPPKNQATPKDICSCEGCNWKRTFVDENGLAQSCEPTTTREEGNPFWPLLNISVSSLVPFHRFLPWVQDDEVQSRAGHYCPNQVRLDAIHQLAFNKNLVTIFTWKTWLQYLLDKHCNSPKYCFNESALYECMYVCMQKNKHHEHLMHLKFFLQSFKEKDKKPKAWIKFYVKVWNHTWRKEFW